MPIRYTGTYPNKYNRYAVNQISIEFPENWDEADASKEKITSPDAFLQQVFLRTRECLSDEEKNIPIYQLSRIIEKPDYYLVYLGETHPFGIIRPAIIFATKKKFSPAESEAIPLISKKPVPEKIYFHQQPSLTEKLAFQQLNNEEKDTEEKYVAWKATVDALLTKPVQLYYLGMIIKNDELRSISNELDSCYMALYTLLGDDHYNNQEQTNQLTEYKIQLVMALQQLMPEETIKWQFSESVKTIEDLMNSKIKLLHTYYNGWIKHPTVLEKFIADIGTVAAFKNFHITIHASIYELEKTVLTAMQKNQQTFKEINTQIKELQQKAQLLLNQNQKTYNAQLQHLPLPLRAFNMFPPPPEPASSVTEQDTPSLKTNSCSPATPSTWS